MSAVAWRPRRGLVAMLGMLALAAGTARADDVRTLVLPNASVADVREALVETIESAGLVVSATIPFNSMLERTGEALGQGANPYVDAVTVQFCSARLAWQLVSEDPAQLALCPMTISVYATSAEPRAVRLSYRSPGQGTPGRRRGEQLLQDLVARAAALGGWR